MVPVEQVYAFDVGLPGTGLQGVVDVLEELGKGDFSADVGGGAGEDVDGFWAMSLGEYL
jgi:hypothetical protein